MRRTVKIKALLSGGGPLRKAAMSSSSAARRPFPAWIDASEGGVAFPAKSAMPRVRDGLVLRTVSKRKSADAKGLTDGHVAR